MRNEEAHTNVARRHGEAHSLSGVDEKPILASFFLHWHSKRKVSAPRMHIQARDVERTPHWWMELHYRCEQHVGCRSSYQVLSLTLLCSTIALVLQVQGPHSHVSPPPLLLTSHLLLFDPLK